MVQLQHVAQAGLPPYIGLPLVIVFAVILGWLIERVVLRPLIGPADSDINHRDTGL